MKTPMEMLLKKLSAAHAVIGEAEWIVKQYLAECKANERDIKVDAPVKIAEAPCVKAATAVTPTKRKLLEPEHIEQCSLFGDLFAANSSAPIREPRRVPDLPKFKVVKPKAVRHPGTPAIGKKQALKNFAEIAGNKVILDLGDVNRIFGYNRSTSGVFIKNAVKNGELKSITDGAFVKYLAKEVRRFITAYYAKADSAN